MKKIMIILLFSFCVLMIKISNVSALDNIEIKEVSVVETSDNATIDISSFNGLTINTDLMLHNLDEYVTYKIVLKNNTSNDYEIESITDNNKLEYITNTYEVFDKKIDSKSEIELLVTTKYIKRISTYKEDYKNNIKITINYNNGESTIIENNVTETNPNTYDNINKFIITFILSLIIILIILFRNKKIKGIAFLLGLMILLPSVEALLVSISITNNMNLTLYAGNYLNSEIVDNSNDVDVNYSEDTKGSAFKFEHPETLQTSELIAYRYIGDEPNNYIYFNCTDEEDTSTCEMWRIIGTFDVEDENGNIERRTKIIPNYSLSTMWKEDNLNNDWYTSSVREYLNEGEFWNKLSNKAKSMIKPTKYYLGGTANTSSSTSTIQSYVGERSLLVNGNNKTNWIGNVGLIYPSDFGYIFSKEFDDSCFNSMFSCYGKNDWLNEIIEGQWAWTISPHIDEYGNAALVVNAPFYIRGAQVFCYMKVNPTVYLSKDVYAIEGNGSKDEPYRIRMDNEV